MVKFCTHCGNPLTGTEKFCTKCGQEIKPNIKTQNDNNDILYSNEDHEKTVSKNEKVKDLYVETNLSDQEYPKQKNRINHLSGHKDLYVISILIFVILGIFIIITWYFLSTEKSEMGAITPKEITETVNVEVENEEIDTEHVYSIAGNAPLYYFGNQSDLHESGFYFFLYFNEEGNYEFRVYNIKEKKLVENISNSYIQHNDFINMIEYYASVWDYGKEIHLHINNDEEIVFFKRVSEKSYSELLAECAKNEYHLIERYKIILEGGMTDENGYFPIKLSFILNSRNEIDQCLYQNLQYGGKIKMEGILTNDELQFTGRDGKNEFIINLDILNKRLKQGTQFIGYSTDGPKKLEVELMVEEINKID